MADEEEERRRRRRNREDEEEAQEREIEGRPDTAKFDELLERAEPMVEQLNHLYNQYVNGSEQRPPVERRRQLDQIMMTLQLMDKPTTRSQFRYNTLHAHYVTHRMRWDRMLRTKENGGKS